MLGFISWGPRILTVTLNGRRVFTFVDTFVVEHRVGGVEILNSVRNVPLKFIRNPLGTMNIYRKFSFTLRNSCCRFAPSHRCCCCCAWASRGNWVGGCGCVPPCSAARPLRLVSRRRRRRRRRCPTRCSRTDTRTYCGDSTRWTRLWAEREKKLYLFFAVRVVFPNWQKKQKKPGYNQLKLNQCGKWYNLFPLKIHGGTDFPRLHTFYFPLRWRRSGDNNTGSQPEAQWILLAAVGELGQVPAHDGVNIWFIKISPTGNKEYETDSDTAVSWNHLSTRGRLRSYWGPEHEYK